MKKIIGLYVDSYRGLSTEAWLLAVVMLINRTGSMVIPFLSMYMSSALNFTKPQVGMVLGCFGLGSVCGSWLGGWLTDKLGNYKVQAFSLILTVPIFLILPNFKTFESLAGMIFLLTLVADTFRPANSVSVARYAKPENLTKAYSLNRMAVNLGFSIGPALGGFLATFSYDWIFYGNAIAALSAAIVFILFFKNRKPRNQIASLLTTEKKLTADDRNAYLDTPFVIFNVFCCLFSMAFFQLLSTLPLFYKEAKMMTEGQIGILLGFSGFCIVVFEMLLVHAVEHRFTPRQVMVYGTGIAGIAYLMLNAPYGVPWLYVSMFILSIGEMLTLPFTATISASRATLNTQGAYMGFNSLAFAAANIFSPYLGTYVAEHYGYNTLWLGTAAVMLFTCLGFSWILKKF
ncbi:MDR family MFS transporter [Sphingobacterium deserti]|uniref:Major facilitator superfamily protein n=1 Tax=Sphingobacterium deserti TaxID=1229276 RepID=A0A0B8SYQ1_9SPHI|nr:MFS transporter [Sphingobacterium deserti]KGE12507.1 major facilitator superfamily protein [Sphingobacterium deserti]